MLKAGMEWQVQRVQGRDKMTFVLPPDYAPFSFALSMHFTSCGDGELKYFKYFKI
jgi:hypothetical protein